MVSAATIAPTFTILTRHTSPHDSLALSHPAAADHRLHRHLRGRQRTRCHRARRRSTQRRTARERFRRRSAAVLHRARRSRGKHGAAAGTGGVGCTQSPARLDRAELRRLHRSCARSDRALRRRSRRARHGHLDLEHRRDRNGLSPSHVRRPSAARSAARPTCIRRIRSPRSCRPRSVSTDRRSPSPPRVRRARKYSRAARG